MVYNWIIENKEFLKIIYALAISFICSLIVLRSDRLFKISDYQGLRYFRNAFFFYGVAFIIRFIIGGVKIETGILGNIYLQMIKTMFEFSIITAGFLLLYTLIWKSIEKQKSFSSLLNKNILIIYLISAALAALDYLFQTDLFMYISQIILFLILTILTVKNIQKSKNTYSIYYVLTMVVGLIAWVLNALLYYVLNWHKPTQISVYLLNVVFFSFILYGTLKITNNNHGKKTRKARDY